MSDLLSAMREFRSLDDRRRSEGLSAEDEARWSELRAAVKGEKSEKAEAAAPEIVPQPAAPDTGPEPTAAAGAPDESGWTWHAESGLYWHAWAQLWYDPNASAWFDGSGAPLAEEAAQRAIAGASGWDPAAAGSELAVLPVDEAPVVDEAPEPLGGLELEPLDEAASEPPVALLPDDEPTPAQSRDAWTLFGGPEGVTPGPAGSAPIDLWSVHSNRQEEAALDDAPTPWSIPADETPSDEEEQAPLSAPEALRPELLPFEVSSIRTLPEVDESAIEAGFGSWPPAEGDAEREPTFGPGRALEVPWDASAGPQPPSAEGWSPGPIDVEDEPTEPTFAEAADAEEVEFSPGPSLDPATLAAPLDELEELEPEAEPLEEVEAEAVELAPAADFLGEAARQAGLAEPEELEELDEAELEEVDSDLPAAVAAIVLDEEPAVSAAAPGWAPAVAPAPAPAPAATPAQPLRREEWFPPSPTPWSLSDAPQAAKAATQGTARNVNIGAPGLVLGEYRVVIHTREGVVKRGAIRDANLTGRTIAFYPPSGAREDLPTAALKVVFFMRGPGESEPLQQGRRVRITFPDGRPLVGFAEDLAEREGFFLVPADARGNTARIWIYRDAVRELALE